MLKERKVFKIGWVLSFLIVLLPAMATPALARAISLKNTGIPFWVFLFVGSIIVLLQAIPAMIVFFSLVGVASKAAYEGKEAQEGRESRLPLNREPSDAGADKAPEAGILQPAMRHAGSKN